MTLFSCDFRRVERMHAVAPDGSARQQAFSAQRLVEPKNAVGAFAGRSQWRKSEFDLDALPVKRLAARTNDARRRAKPDSIELC